MKIRIIVATHKPYRMPENSLYLPLLVGAENNKPTWTGRRDNEGENISAKNPHYCELTGLYWAWKNLDTDYVGLVHYRRHFSTTASMSTPIMRKTWNRHYRSSGKNIRTTSPLSKKACGSVPATVST